MSKPIKAYEVVGWPGGMVSRYSKHYSGHVMTVLARSSRQALFLAGNAIWFDGPEADPGVGIVAHYSRDEGETLWTGEGPQHPNKFHAGMTAAQVRSAMVEHLNVDA